MLSFRICSLWLPLDTAKSEGQHAVSNAWPCSGPPQFPVWAPLADWWKCQQWVWELDWCSPAGGTGNKQQMEFRWCGPKSFYASNVRHPLPKRLTEVSRWTGHSISSCSYNIYIYNYNRLYVNLYTVLYNYIENCIALLEHIQPPTRMPSCSNHLVGRLHHQGGTDAPAVGDLRWGTTGGIIPQMEFQLTYN